MSVHIPSDLPSPDRRSFLRTAAGAAVIPMLGAGFSLGGWRPASAAAPMLGVQPPSWYRFKVGEFEATVVSDGVVPLGEPSGGFPTAPKAEVADLLTRNFLPTDRITLEQNALVLNTGRNLALFDTGMGTHPMFGPTTGKLLQNLRAAGIDPDQIDSVILTHAHCDHCWGVMADSGKPNFPNARVYVTKADFDFWTDDGKLSRTDWVKTFVEGAKKNLLPVKDRITWVEDGKEVIPGVQAMYSPGHTIGHVSYMITSGSSSLLNIGDLAHHQVLLLRKPNYEFAYDTDPKQSAQTRSRILAVMAKDRIPLIGYHFPFPGMGNVAAEGDGFGWYPLPMGTAL